MTDSDKGISRRITRREVLLGAGAMTISMGAITLASRSAEAAFNWNREADILVVGSGAAASTAAVTANQNGDTVVLIEKAPVSGGTTIKSAGVLWIPNNFTLKAKGIDDNKQDCLRYMARFSYPQRYRPSAPNLGVSEAEYQLIEAFYDNAANAIDRLRENGDIKVAEWRMFALDRPATDYLAHVPENKVPAGRALGPIQADGTMGQGSELIAQLHAALIRRGVPLLTNHRAARIILKRTGSRHWPRMRGGG